MDFRISDRERSQLLDALGRRDGSAEHLIDDIERALADCERGLSLANYGVMPAELRASWSLTGDLAGRLRSQLYALPERAREIVTLSVLTQSDLPPLLRAAEECGRAIDQLAPLLERIEAACGQARASTHGVSEHALRGVLHAFRNRTNIKPNLDPGGPFLRFLAMLVRLVGGRFPEFAQLATGLNGEQLEAMLSH
jgi:hypothetical protein